jgi:hypothetical protein
VYAKNTVVFFKVVFLITRTVVDSKPEKVLNVYKIIDNVFNNSINHHSFNEKTKYHDLISIGHTFDPVPVKNKRNVGSTVKHGINSVPVELFA